jgi:apolipoprotein N-acyltransferase
MDVRRRFWIETVLASGCALLAVVTAVWHDWIELGFDVDPDHGSGALEWLIVALALAVAVAFGMLARAEWRSYGS